jgi:hypothetical protein
MKRLFLLLAIASMAVFTSCKDDDNGGQTSKSTETTAEFDNSNFGLYKGVIVGSSGTVKIQLMNGNNTAKADIVMDGKTDVLTCTGTLTNGQAITNAAFTGASSSFTFSVGGDGSNPVISNFNIEGHEDVSAVVLKETSENVSSAYEGTTTGGNNAFGVLNAVRNNNTYSGMQKALDVSSGGLTFSFKGNIGNDGSFSGTSSSNLGNMAVNLTYSGKFVGDNVSGTWTTSWRIEDTNYSNTGTFTGKKTL